MADWAEMTIDERRRMVGLMFEEIRAGHDGIEELVPREEWKLYVRMTVPERVEMPALRMLSERKTGLYVPNVETVRLVRDERGWLRLAV